MSLQLLQIELIIALSRKISQTPHVTGKFSMLPHQFDCSGNCRLRKPFLGPGMWSPASFWKTSPIHILRAAEWFNALLSSYKMMIPVLVTCIFEAPGSYHKLPTKFFQKDVLHTHYNNWCNPNPPHLTLSPHQCNLLSPVCTTTSPSVQSRTGQIITGNWCSGTVHHIHKPERHMV